MRSEAQTPVYMDASRPVEERVKSLMDEMTLEEKVAQMDQFSDWDLDEYKKNPTLLNNLGVGSIIATPATPEAYNELQALSEKSRLKIPFLIGTDAAHGMAVLPGYTVFPTSISQAATFNPELVNRIATAASEEIRAAGIHWTFAPCIDITQDARWGRTGETYGECPFLTSALVRQAIRGYQNHPNPQDRVAACVKHLVGGGRSIGGVNHGTAEISERMLRSFFLPPFDAAIQENVMTIMPGHNDINGIPAHSNKWLLTDIMRKELGFKGFYITDMKDIENLISLHRTATNQKDAVRQGIAAGLDMHMYSTNMDQFINPMLELIKEGAISQEQIDESVARILRVKFELGLFENRYVKTTLPYATPKAHQLALDAARESIILLKNEEGLLPLDKKKYKRILITGPNANNHSILGDWSREQPEENVTTIYEGIRDYLGKDVEVIYSHSGRLKGKKSDVEVNTTDPATQQKVLEEGGEMNDFSIADATEKAKSCELAIVAVGGYGLRYDWGLRTYGESADRPSIDLYGRQEELVRSIAATGTPVIVVIVNGKPLNNEWITKNIPTIVDAWEPGIYGGRALAEILFGEVNPSGRLPITIPQSAGHIPQYYYQTKSRTYTGYGLGSSRKDDKPAFPFGHGLSYTTFEYGTPQLNDTLLHEGRPLELSIAITNRGKRIGAETVQCYIQDEVSSVVTPLMLLKGFQKIWLNPGETKTVKITIPFEEFGLWNQAMKHVVEPGGFTVMVGSSSADIKHRKHIEYKGAPVEVRTPTPTLTQ